MAAKSKLKNITLSANEDLIALARKKAQQNNRTLNDAFREWLEQFTNPISSSDEYGKLMDSMKGALSGAAKAFSREDANER